MDPNDDNSIFNFINNLTSIPLDRDDFATDKSPKMMASGNLPCADSFPVDYGLLKKEFKALSICDPELSSTGHSDKSLSSFGSDSNDSNGETGPPGGPEGGRLTSGGLSGGGGHTQAGHNHNHSHNHHTNGSTLRRESSQSPSAFFGFSSSSSSSPPLSQTSGPSSASSLLEAVSTVANGASMVGVPSSGANHANSNFSFNSLSNAGKSRDAGLSFNASKNGDGSSSSSSFLSNPLDSMFGSILSSKGLVTPGDSFSALLDSSSPFVQSSSGLGEAPSPLEPRRFGATQASHPPSLLPTSFSQDSLPHFLQNSSFTPFSSNLQSDSETAFLSAGHQTQGQAQAQAQTQRKFSLFNGNSSNPTNSPSSSGASLTAVCTSSSLSSPIISAPLFSSTSNFLSFNDSTLDQRTNSLLAHSSSPMGGGPATNGNGTVSSQTRFESHIRLLANEINSTVQLYMSSLQMRRDQLLKQLEHVRATYIMMLAQNKGKGQGGGLASPVAFPRITFSRTDASLFKMSTSFGFLNSPAFAPFCHVTGDGLVIAVEGEASSFTISMRNCFNEEIHQGGESIDIDLQSIDSSVSHHNGGGSSFISGLPHIQKNIVDNSNGKYTVNYMVPLRSSLRSVKIFININGLPVNNSPFLATVKVERIRENWKRAYLFGEEGSEGGKFCRPWGVAMVGLPIVKDPNHKPIGGEANQSIPLQSKPFYSWKASSPQKKDYLLTVADRSNNRIQLLKLTVAERSPNSTPSNESIFSSNYHLNGNIDVSVLHIFGSGPGIRHGQFDRPAGIAINSNFGQIVVVDKDNHRIQVFDLTGNFLFKFGEKGARAGQFCYPWDIAICPQTSLLLVSDTRNRRIQLFTHFGQYLWHCGQPLDSPRGVAFLTPERYIVSDFNKHRLLIIDKNDPTVHSSQGTNGRDDLINSKYIGFGEGSAWGEFLRPQGIVATVSRSPLTGGSKYVQVLCADSRNNRIAIWNSLNQNFDYINDDNTKGDPIAHNFDRPSGIALADNILAVVDFGNNRLQIFQRNSA